jgi:hypothetical protein
MVKIENFETQNNSESQTNSSQKCGFENQTNQTQSNSQTQNKGLLTIIGQLLPLAPFAFEQFTGQKVPHMSGTMAEIQTVLNNLQLAQTQIIQSQQVLSQRLTALESIASQQFTNLANQFQSLRLTHTREQKQVEFNPNPKLDEDPNY